MGRVACITTLDAFPGRRDELIELCKKHIEVMLAAEPGSQRMEILTPFEETDRIVIWDVYESLEAVNAHRSGAQLREFLEEAKGLMASMSGVRHMMIE